MTATGNSACIAVGPRAVGPSQLAVDSLIDLLADSWGLCSLPKSIASLDGGLGVRSTRRLRPGGQTRQVEAVLADIDGPGSGQRPLHGKTPWSARRRATQPR